MSAAIDPSRLEFVLGITLADGCHESITNGACVMEAVSYVAGEPWSDSPICACPVISSFLRTWNDSLPEADRNRFLKPLIPQLIGTRGSDTLAQRRSLMAADWLVRTHTPAWLRLADLREQADALAALPEITAMAQVPSIKPAIEAARRDATAALDSACDAAKTVVLDSAWDAAFDSAWDAARDSAWDSAWDVARAAALGSAKAAALGSALDSACDAAKTVVLDSAWDAARAAARAVALDAARAVAWDAARAAALDTVRAVVLDSAWDATLDSAWDAAWDAVRDALDSTKRELQGSALKLVDRMINARDEAHEREAGNGSR